MSFKMFVNADNIVSFISNLWSLVCLILAIVICFQFLAKRRYSNAPWMNYQHLPSGPSSSTYASTIYGSEPSRYPNNLINRPTQFPDTGKSLNDVLRFLLGQSSNHDVILSPIDDLELPPRSITRLTSDPYLPLSSAWSILNCRLNQLLSVALTAIADSRAASEQLVVWALGVAARLYARPDARSSSVPPAYQRHQRRVTFSIPELTANGQRNATNYTLQTSPSPGNDDLRQSHQQHRPSIVNDETRLFCLFYLLAIICVVFTQPPLVQVAVCVAFCITIQSLDMRSTSLPPAAVDLVTTSRVDRPFDNFDPINAPSIIAAAPVPRDRHPLDGAWRPLPVNHDDRAVDVVSRFLVVRLSDNRIARLFCSVLTGAVATLNAANYPQTVIVVLVWFSIYETTECLLVLGFLKRLLFSSLHSLIVKQGCRSCRDMIRHRRPLTMSSQ